jgi:DNA-binding Lrp family transcriptional regulator
VSKKLGDIVNEIKYRGKLTLDDIAEKIGYSRPYLSNAIKNNTGGKILEIIEREYSEILQKVPVQTEEETSIGALYTIAKSNESLARGNEKLAEANLKLVESNLALTNRLNLMSPKTGEFQGIPEELLPKISDLLELIAEAGTQGWKSKKDALVELNTRFYGVSKKGKVKDNLPVEGK